VKLLTRRNLLLSCYLELTTPISISDPVLLSLAFFLLPRLKLDLPLKSKYLDDMCAEAFVNSSAVNLTYELLPSRYEELFKHKNPFSGFKKFVADSDISCSKNDRTLAILNLKSPQDDHRYRMKVEAFQLALELLFEDAVAINESLGSKALPSYQQLRCDQGTENLIDELYNYFARNDYGGINYQQLVFLAECIAYTKRFYRKCWRVEIEDVLEAWFFINYFRTPRSPLQGSDKGMLQAIDARNRAGVLPSQRQIIKKTGLATKTVNKALGLKINNKDGRGSFFTVGYVDYDESQKGYRLKEMGKIALTNEFYVSIDGRTYTPKDPLNHQE
jgi:hypothetical protein